MLYLFLLLSLKYHCVIRFFCKYVDYFHLLTYLLHGAEPLLRSYLVLQVVKKFPAFSEPEGSSPYPQVPATRPYPQPTPFNPHNSLPLSEDPS
jgi:hypothetical protein